MRHWREKLEKLERENTRSEGRKYLNLFGWEAFALLSRSRRLSLRLSPELERRIRQYARSVGKRPSVIVREVLEQHFADDRPVVSCYDLARQAGVIGCAVNTPPDLSTSLAYPVVTHYSGGRRKRSSQDVNA